MAEPLLRVTAEDRLRMDRARWDLIAASENRYRARLALDGKSGNEKRRAMKTYRQAEDAEDRMVEAWLWETKGRWIAASGEATRG